MKKIVRIVLLTVLFSCSLTGCVTSKTREDIIAKLEKENIIKDDWEYYCTCINGGDPIPWISSYDYVYLDDDGDIHVVNITERDENDEYTIKVTEAEEIIETEYTDAEGKVSIDYEVRGESYSQADTYKMKYVSLLWFKFMLIKE